MDYLSAWLDYRIEDMSGRGQTFRALKIQEDPEAIFQEGWLLCDVGEHARGLGFLQRGVAKGYYPVATLASRSQFDPLRGDPAFMALQAEAVEGRQHALMEFRDAGGERLLGS
jgi:hypothetical protein